MMNKLEASGQALGFREHPQPVIQPALPLQSDEVGFLRQGDSLPPGLVLDKGTMTPA